MFDPIYDTYLYFLLTARNVQTKLEPMLGAVLQVLVSAALVSDCKMNTESWLEHIIELFIP